MASSLIQQREEMDRKGTLQASFRKMRSDVSDAPIVILCPAMWGIRNMVHSGVTSLLRTRGFRVILLAAKDLSYEPINGSTEKGCELLKAPEIRSQRGKSALEAFLRASFHRRYRISTHRIKERWHRRNHSLWVKTRNALIELVSIVGSKDPFFHWQIEYLDQFRRRTQDLSPIALQLKELQPSLVVSTSCVFNEDELPYLMIAHDQSIPTLGCILSFDNLTTRGILPLFDYYAVWNQRMKEQLLRYYPQRIPSRIHITGTPQFDFHARQEFRWSREMTLKRLGLTSNERYFLYAANHPIHTPTEPELVEELSARCEKSPDLKAHRLVIRPHPLDQTGRWEYLAGRDARVVVSRPSGRGSIFGAVEDQFVLVSTLLHADVCVNTASTMSLDAAALGTPVVCVAFAVRRGTEDRYVKAAYQQEHYLPIAESGGVRLASNMDQLVAEIEAYVRDRNRDKVKRERLIADECGPVDGLAAERIAELISHAANQTKCQKTAFVYTQ
jgi:hypothetical protein